ncbi:hypothetical protein ADE_38670 [Achromobacter denitrificans]|uniref:hypothetical protein n=1 Tax=Achromobacter denitrificans TaxID=32002 RepID=UPI00166EAF24|nr:hypothetical protein [Achromobacter denitrificans]GFN28169.1 hypothetical protein ADE_38670 [Achromobacter denitrificans]
MNNGATALTLLLACQLVRIRVNALSWSPGMIRDPMLLIEFALAKPKSISDLALTKQWSSDFCR